MTRTTVFSGDVFFPLGTNFRHVFLLGALFWSFFPAGRGSQRVCDTGVSEEKKCAVNWLFYLNLAMRHVAWVNDSYQMISFFNFCFDFEVEKLGPILYGVHRKFQNGNQWLDIFSDPNILINY